MSQEHVRPNDTSRGRVGTETETAQQTRTKINGNGHRPTSETRRGGDFPTNCQTPSAARYFHFTVSIPGALPIADPHVERARAGATDRRKPANRP